MEKIQSPITSITGIGTVTGATILSEVGDISRFDSPKKLVAFDGIDASVSQSGKFEAMQERLLLSADLIAEDPKMLEVLRLAKKVAAVDRAPCRAR